MPFEPMNQVAVRCLSQMHGFYNGQGDFQRRAAYAKALTWILMTEYQVTTLVECTALTHIGIGKMGRFVVAAANGIIPQVLIDVGCY